MMNFSTEQRHLRLASLIRLMIALVLTAVITLSLSGIASATDWAGLDDNTANAPAIDPSSFEGEVEEFRLINYKLIEFETVGVDGVTPESMWVGIISGELDFDVALPALIEIAVPEGTHTGWFGQLAGLDNPDSAIQFQEPYTMRTENGMDIYSAVLTMHHIVQLEIRFEGNPILESPEGTRVMEMSYTPVNNARELHLTAAFPADYASTDQELSFLGEGPNGEQTYSRIFTDVVGGETYTTTIEGIYVGEGTAESGTPITTVLIVGAIALVLVAVVIFAYVRGQKQ